MFGHFDPISIITGLIQGSTYVTGLIVCSQIKPAVPPGDDVVENVLNDEKVAQIGALDEKVLV